MDNTKLTLMQVLTAETDDDFRELWSQFMVGGDLVQPPSQITINKWDGIEKERNQKIIQ